MSHKLANRQAVEESYRRLALKHFGSKPCSNFFDKISDEDLKELHDALLVLDESGPSELE